MPRPSVALFSDKGNPQTAAIARAVSAKGGRAEVLDLRMGAGGFAANPARGRLVWGGVDLSHVSIAHVVCTAPSTPVCLPPVLHAASFASLRAGFVAEQERQAAVMTFFQMFAARGGVVVNPLSGVYIDHDSKTQFYEKIRSWGLDAPRTLTTNDPALISAFLDEAGQAVVKPAMGVGAARAVGGEDRGRAPDASRCPVLLQERVYGTTCRVHIVADTVVCAIRVDGQEVDSRSGERSLSPVSLTPEHARGLVRANRKLGLHYSAWDVIVTPQGRCVCLDCNPGPYVLWIGGAMAQGVIDQLAAHLVTYAGTGCLEAASRAVAPIQA